MKPDRLCAFTDGVIAIIITIMVLELPVPHEAGVTRDTVLAFGAVMLMSALGFAWLRSALLASNDDDAPIVRATSHGRKGQITLISYVAALPIGFVSPIAAIIIYVIVALMWLIPDRRFEGIAE